VTVLAVFGAIALVLAGIGLYGVMAASVSQSTRELGLRLALGASGSDLLWLAISKGLMLTSAGVLLGAGAALEVTRLMGYVLYGVSPRDPLSFGFAFGVIVIAALTACVAPSMRAMRADPVVALRG
jgi:ABC-type antimicrobial peptide transport system permease subunit